MPCQEKISEGKEKCQFMLKWSLKSLVKASSHSLHEEKKVRVCMIPYLESSVLIYSWLGHCNVN